MRHGLIPALCVCIALSAGCGGGPDASASAVAPPDSARVRLQEIRNLGKAFYENPATQNLAPEELRKAVVLNPDSAREHLNLGLALLRTGKTSEGMASIEKAKSIDPSIPHIYFNLGVEFKKRGEAAQAIEQFQQMLRLVPGHAKAHYQLGSLYRQQNKREKALPEFETAAELDPSLAAPHFQLFNLLRRSDPDRARREIEIFKKIKAAQAESADSEDVDWSFYSELYDPVEPLTPAQPAPPSFASVELPGAGASRFEKLAIIDANADGRPDVVAWSESHAALLIHHGASFVSSVPPGLARLDGIRDLAAGDADNDGRQDLAAATASGVFLILQGEDGFREAPKLLAGGDFHAVVWADYDHDYDLDLFALGKDQKLLRNNGDGSYLDVSEKFPFRHGAPVVAAALLEVQEDNGNDLLIAYSDQLVLFEDRKLGRFDPVPIAGITPGSDASLAVLDLNNDGYADAALTLGGPSGGTLLLENRDGVLTPGRTLARALAWADTQNRSWADLLSPEGLRFGQGNFEFSSPAPLGGSGALAAVAADFDADGKEDFLVLDASGTPRLLRNTIETSNQHVTIALQGVKNQILAEGSRVEVKAGMVYRKRVYRGHPLVFGLGSAETIDTVRITWANGLIQNESQQAAGLVHEYVEKPRLSGSCPMIFVWDGEKFAFVSDVLGVAPLGAGLGDGEFFPTDHDEYVWIDGTSLAAREGFYEVRVTEELREVSYLDQIKLIAVDHPAEVEIYTNEKFISPPFPRFRLYGVKERIYPATARDHEGSDVLDRVLKTDRRYPDAFRRDFAGRAERHSLTLDFPGLADRDDAVLFLRGWVDWADGSTFVAAAQSRVNQLMGPQLQVRDPDGEWVTVLEDMGMPAGKPKTIAVDLKGRFLSGSREVRILTNLCVYWDEIFAATGTDSPTVTLTEQFASEAELRFRGFSAVRLDPARRQPESFDYQRVLATSMWNPTPGLYTRYGEVRELLERSDDRFVIMGSGDELVLRFPVADLPNLPPGWERDFLLFFDGWAKDADSNTAFGQTVEPLPFHSMSGYPYRASEHYPNSAAHRTYLREYLQRRALRLIRPLSRRSESNRASAGHE